MTWTAWAQHWKVAELPGTRTTRTYDEMSGRWWPRGTKTWPDCVRRMVGRYLEHGSHPVKGSADCYHLVEGGV